MTASRLRGALGFAAVALALAPPAFAQSAADAAAADALFTAAQKLAAAGKFEEACPKFAESLRLDSGIGVMLYLADCWERTGKTASAWAQFREAEELAARQGDKRAGTAHQRAAALEPLLARLVVRVASAADIAGLELRRDATTLGRAQWGVAVPVDPGRHVIVASAPGKKTRELPVQVLAGGSPTVLQVEALEDGVDVQPAPGALVTPEPTGSPPSRPATLPASPVDAVSPSRDHTLAFAVGGVGLAGIAVGAFFGFETISKNNASNSNGHCHSDNTCDSTGINLRNDAKSSAMASNIAFGAGVAFLAAGAVLYFLAPSRPSPAMVGLAPAPDGRGGSVFLSHAW